MKHSLPALVLAVASVVPAAALAQTKPTDVYVSVLDSKGDPATGLAAADFQVREDGVVREVLKAAQATEPLTVALLVDDSQALTPAVQMVREAVNAFITALSGKAEIAIITFGERPTIAQDYTSDQQKLHDTANRIFPRTGAGAYLMDTIIEVSKGLQKREAARPVIAVLMMEDGVEFSNRHYDQVLDPLAKGRAALHVVSLQPVMRCPPRGGSVPTHCHRICSWRRAARPTRICSSRATMACISSELTTCAWSTVARPCSPDRRATRCC